MFCPRFDRDFMNVREFINQVFLNEYSQIVTGFSYISFALIGLGIEFLGACLDSHEFGQKGQSGLRVRAAILDLFPAAYHVYADELSGDLRNGFAHQFRPGLSLELTHRAEASVQEWKHP